MKKLNLAIALSLLATTAVAGIASAEPGARRGDADGNGVTTRAEAQAHAAEMFARLDGNKDGKLDPADRAAHQAAMFDQLDANKDGAISRDEFASAHPDRGGEGGPGARAERSGEPGGEHGPGMGRHGGGGGMMMARMADADKDGSVTQAEFSTAALAHFDKVDTNKDGQLSREERRAAHQQMREHMGKMRGGHEGHPPPAG
jgi:hypothetical protein